MSAPESSDVDMDALASRIAAVKSAPQPESVRLFVLDAMVPGQCLEMDDVPEPFACALEECERSSITPVIVGRVRTSLLSHAVECRIEKLQRRADGSASATLLGGRYCEILDVGPDEGSRWLGRSGTANWCAVSAPPASHVGMLRPLG